MASMASQLIEEVTAHAQSDSLNDTREICADGTYFPNNLRIYATNSLELNRNILGCTTVFATCPSLNPCRKVVLEKLMGSQVARAFSALYRKQRFITTFTRACHLFPRSDKGVQSMPSHTQVPANDILHYYTCRQPPLVKGVSPIRNPSTHHVLVTGIPLKLNININLIICKIRWACQLQFKYLDHVNVFFLKFLTAS